VPDILYFHCVQYDIPEDTKAATLAQTYGEAPMMQSHLTQVDPLSPLFQHGVSVGFLTFSTESVLGARAKGIILTLGYVLSVQHRVVLAASIVEREIVSFYARIL